MNTTLNMEQVREYLPLLIPIVIVELALWIYALIHILKHDHYKHGNRVIWLIVILLGSNLIGPLLYLMIGKEED